MIGLNNEDVIAGRVELCYDEVWRAVCFHRWDLRDAEVVCRQMLNLSQSGIHTGSTIWYITVNFLLQIFWFICAQTLVLAEAH